MPGTPVVLSYPAEHAQTRRLRERPSTAGRIVRFWLPLEATWLMMAAEGPFVAAVIARLADPKENLAAFAVASALAWIVESPIIMMLSASNALVRDGVAYRKLQDASPWPSTRRSRRSWPSCIVPPVFDLVARGVMGLSPGRRRAGRPVDDLPRPLAGGHRLPPLLPGHPHQRRPAAGRDLGDGHPPLDHGRDRPRLRPWSFDLPGASVGAGALGAGVIAEAAASWVMARPTVRRLRRQSRRRVRLRP
ncbi:MAG: hypothetical protein MZU91_11470 [Desulfosudis oleivorans]|nr:hypothetical protein [Desulfosudis oleivorans]